MGSVMPCSIGATAQLSACLLARVPTVCPLHLFSHLTSSATIKGDIYIADSMTFEVLLTGQFTFKTHFAFQANDLVSTAI